MGNFNRTPVLLVSLVSLATATGCPPARVAHPRLEDADRNSGPDGQRTGAVPIELNRASAPDAVSFAGNDRTDWKSIELKGRPGPLTVELHWDNANSDLQLDVFDPLGQPIIGSTPPSPGTQAKIVTADITGPGIYYLRVQASRPQDGSIYTLLPKWEGEVAAENDPTHPRAHIVQAYRGDDGQMVLYLDRGSDAGIEVGMSGVILAGPAGDTPLAGGDFKISEVVGPTKSIAKSPLESIGTNTRCVINAMK